LVSKSDKTAACLTSKARGRVVLDALESRFGHLAPADVDPGIAELLDGTTRPIPD
jgi:hypothetical protein